MSVVTAPCPFRFLALLSCSRVPSFRSSVPSLLNSLLHYWAAGPSARTTQPPLLLNHACFPPSSPPSLPFSLSSLRPYPSVSVLLYHNSVLPARFPELGIPGHWYSAMEWQYPPHQRQGSYEEEGRALNFLKAGITCAGKRG